MEVARALKGLISAAAFLSGVLAPEVASAADISSVKLDDTLMAIILVGNIESGDDQKFRSEAQKYDDAVVLLESEGGSVTAAIQIGEAIRLKGFSTAVINGSECNSACALIWLAGSPRALSKSARVGFHAAYSDASGADRESGVGNALVGRYLTLLNLPERAVMFATTAPPTSLNWLTSSNYGSTGIDTSVIDDISLDQKTTAKQDQYRAQSRPETELWRQLDKWGVYVDHTVDNGCFIMASFNNDTNFRIGVDHQKSGSYYVIIGNSNWKSLRADADYRLTFTFDDETPWDVPTTGVQMGDEVDLIALFSDTKFWSEFVGSSVLDVSKDDRSVTRISMAGTKHAFDELIRCEKYEIANNKNRDPFAK